MHKRFVTIWFRHLITDWLVIRQPALSDVPFIVVAKHRGRLVITAANILAENQGVTVGMAAADAKAIIPGLQVIDDRPGQAAKLLKALGEWCIRYSPIIAIDLPDGLILDVSGCAHLWGSERAYLKEIVTRLRSKGYDVRAAMADTVGTAWAISRFGQVTPIIESGGQATALLPLPPCRPAVGANSFTAPAKTWPVPGQQFYTYAAFCFTPPFWRKPAAQARTGAGARGRGNYPAAGGAALPGTFALPGADMYRYRHRNCHTTAAGNALQPPARRRQRHPHGHTKRIPHRW